MIGCDPNCKHFEDEDDKIDVLQICFDLDLLLDISERIQKQKCNRQVGYER